MTGPLTLGEIASVRAILVDCGEPVIGPLRASLLSGGRSNLTVRLADDRSRWVLRTPPRHGRTPSAHDVAREYTVTSALAGSAMPVARAVVLHEQDDALGGPFAIWEFVSGVTVQSHDDLELLSDQAVDEIATDLVTTLAELHRIDHCAVGLASFGRPDAYAERQLRRWSRQWELVAPHDAGLRAAADDVRERLARSIPAQRATGIVHGDFRIDNALLALDPGSPHVAAMVDWELSTIGDPVADVATMCAYRHPAFDLVLGFPTAWTSDRLPGVPDLATRYEAAGGCALVDWERHLALAHYKIAVIAAGIEHRRRAAGGAGDRGPGRAVMPFLQGAARFL